MISYSNLRNRDFFSTTGLFQRLTRVKKSSAFIRGKKKVDGSQPCAESANGYGPISRRDAMPESQTCTYFAVPGDSETSAADSSREEGKKKLR